MTGPQLIPHDFSGLVGLFPLPDLVMFPHVVQPLRVFEPRYVAMFEDALARDQLIAMALLKAGWEAEYDHSPPIHDTVCVGRVISHSRQSDGTYNLLLAGAMRAQIRDEETTADNFRRASVELIVDRAASDHPDGDPQMRDDLLAAFEKLTPSAAGLEPMVEQLLKNQVSLGMLTDVIAFSLPLPLPVKQSLLDDAMVESRARSLIIHLRQLAKPNTPTFTPSGLRFPPDFSDN